MEIYGLDSNAATSVSTAATTDKQTFGAQVVTKTLDYMNNNSGNSGGTNSDYDFQKSVLGATYSPLGALTDTKV